MNNLCKEHEEKYMTGCLQCERMFCRRCKSKMKDCNIREHDLLPFEEYIIEISKPTVQEYDEISNNLFRKKLESLENIKIVKEELFNISKIESLKMKEIKEKINKLCSILKMLTLQSSNRFKSIIRTLKINTDMIKKNDIQIQLIKDKDKNQSNQMKLKIDKAPLLGQIENKINFVKISKIKEEIPEISIEENYDELKFGRFTSSKAFQELSILKKNKYYEHYLNSIKDAMANNFLNRINNISGINGKILTIVIGNYKFKNVNKKMNENCKILALTKDENMEHRDKYPSGIVYLTRKNKLLESFIKKSKIFISRKTNILRLLLVKQKMLLKYKKIKIFADTLNKIWMKLKYKSQLIIPNGIFKKNFYRKGSRSVAFERKRVNSPFLFYFVFASPMVVHILHLLNQVSQTIPFYNETGVNDMEMHEGSIYSCGGYETETLTSSWTVNLSNFNNTNAHAIPELINPRYNTSMLSTPFGLFALGGYHHRYSYLSSCEKFDDTGIWCIVGDLNFASCYITATFVYPSYIYCLGGYPGSYEKLEIKSKEVKKWEPLEISSGISYRCSGCSLQLNDKEFLLFGGAPLIEFTIFNKENLTLQKTDKAFNSYNYSGSKIRLVGKIGHIISYYSAEKRILIKSIKSKEFEELPIDF